MAINIKDKTTKDVLDEFLARDNHNTLAGEQYSAAIIVKASKDLSDSADRIQSSIIKLNGVINQSEHDLKTSIDSFKDSVVKIGNSSDQLSSKLLWLNIVLTIATAVGTIVSIVNLFVK